MLNNPLLKSTLILGIFALVGVALVAATYLITQPYRIRNEHLSLLRRLEVLVPATTVDNDLVNDYVEVNAKNLLGADTSRIYLGRKQETPVAAIINATIPNGYAGPINLLVAVRKDGVLNGVRVLAHKETPGLGDKIEEQKSNWIFNFKNKSLTNPPQAEWEAKRDGGYFDQMTGATITSRAVIHATRDALIFAQQQGVNLYKNVPQRHGIE